MGKQRDTDKVSAMLQEDRWEDDPTATKAATTCAGSERDPDSNIEEDFGEKNRYRKSPIKPMYRRKGASKTGAKRKCKAEKRESKEEGKFQHKTPKKHKKTAKENM